MSRATHYRPRKRHKFKCRACPNWFYASREDARYCGPACRKAISRALRAQAEWERHLAKQAAAKRSKAKNRG